MRRHEAILVLVCALGFVAAILSGCEAPEGIQAEDRAATESLESYHSNVGQAIDGMVKAYREQALDALSLRVELSLEQEKLDLYQRVIDEEGNETWEPYEAHDPEIIAAAFVLFREKLGLIEGEIIEFLAEWREANMDYLDAMAFRDDVTRFLQIAGVDPAAAGEVFEYLKGKGE